MERMVKKAFPWSPNGVKIEHLVPGDARDFGDHADGLEAAGYIGAVGEVLKQPEGGKHGTDAGDVSAVEIPADWSGLHHATRKKLAREISGDEPADTAAADAVIAAELARREALQAVG